MRQLCYYIFMDDLKNIPEDAWKNKLTLDQYRVMREKGTEPAFTGKYYHNTEKGEYVCAACGQKLFFSDTKFDSGTGWPSFTDPMNRENVELKEDQSHGMSRVEVLCKNCGAHLGHVFDDLPAGRQAGPNSKRYCINSICLDFKKTGDK